MACQAISSDSGRRGTLGFKGTRVRSTGYHRSESPERKNELELRRAIAGATEHQIQRFFRLRVPRVETYLSRWLMNRMAGPNLRSFWFGGGELRFPRRRRFRSPRAANELWLVSCDGREVPGATREGSGALENRKSRRRPSGACAGLGDENHDASGGMWD